MPLARRQLLTQVAGREFAEHGYVDASLNRIIADCGMGKSSFYYLFASKSELFEFVTAELVSETRARWSAPDPAALTGPAFWPGVRAVFDDFLRVAAQHESFLLLGRLFYSDAPGSAKAAVGGALAAVEDWVRGVLAEGRRCGEVRDDLPEALQYALVVAMLRTFDEWSVTHHDQIADPAAVAEAQFATLRRALAA